MDLPIAFSADLAARPSLSASVQHLGARIEAEWHEAGYDDDQFPSIAERALLEAQIHAHYDAHDVIREGVCAPLYLPQMDIRARFGQPPITFFNNPRFYIAVLFWTDSTTSVHEHGFSGAFSVLDGASLHVSYAFAARTRINSRFAIGEIRRGSATILERGAVRRIEAGARGAHALFHLERPSATLLVRSHTDPRAHPQLTYHWPCFAIDPFFDDPVTERRCQLLRLAYDTDKALFKELATELLLSCDLESAIRALLFMRRLRLSPTEAREFAAVAAGPHGALGSNLPGLVEDGARESRLVALRGRVFDREPRLLLAFLLNRVAASDAKDLVAQRYPDQPPEELIAGWTEALLSELGGIPTNPVVKSAIRSLLVGDGAAAAQGRVENEFGITGKADQEAVGKVVRMLLDSPILAPLLGQAESPEVRAGRTNNQDHLASPGILRIDRFRPAEECRAFRQAYDDGLRRGLFIPRETNGTVVPLEAVIGTTATRSLCEDVAGRLRAHFDLPPLCLDYCTFSRMRDGARHKLHADAVKLDGTPNHTPDRVTSAMLYLTEAGTDFAGGDIGFPQLGVEVMPRVGQLVGFLTTLAYQHEVSPVASGVRDAVAIWFRHR